MAQDNFANQGQQFAAKAADFSRAVLKIVSEDVRTWDVFRWLVIVLLALNLLLLLSLGGIKSEIAALKQDRSAAAEEVARATKEIADTRAALTQAISDMSVVESRRKERVSATRIAPGPRCRVATSSRLVMQPIRARAFCNRSITIGATASPAIRLRVSLASTKATLASKRPMAIDAMPSAQVT